MNQNGADEGVASELALTAVNDYQMYRWAKSIIINYAQKRVKGTYSRELAIKGFVPIVESALKEHRKFTREYYEGERSVGRVSMATKRLAAAEILDHYEDSIREMTQKMQGVKDSGKPWIRRNAEGREWYSVAKKGRGQAKREPDVVIKTPEGTVRIPAHKFVEKPGFEMVDPDTGQKIHVRVRELAKKGRRQAKPGKTYTIEYKNGRVETVANVTHHKRPDIYEVVQLDGKIKNIPGETISYIEARISRAKPSHKPAKKPAASFGGIRIGRVW